MRTRSAEAKLQAWTLLDLYEALVEKTDTNSDPSKSAGWPGTLHISESSHAVERFAETGGIPRFWAQGIKVIPASELSDEVTPTVLPGDTPTHVVHVDGSVTSRYYLRLPDADIRQELPNFIKLRRWGRELPTWKLAGFVSRDAEESDDILAILMEPKGMTAPLGSMTLAEVNEESKKKWADQVEATMRCLLDIGVTWPDLGLDDIEVDEDDDVLFTRFTRMKLHDEGDFDVAEGREELKKSVREFRAALGLSPVTNELLWVEEDDEEEDDDFNPDDEESEEDEDDLSFTDDDVESNDLPTVKRPNYRV